MSEARYTVTLCREGQPAHQMAEMNATVPGSVLLAIVRAMIEERDDGSMGSWLAGEGIGPVNFGTLKSLTIVRAEDWGS